MSEEDAVGGGGGFSSAMLKKRGRENKSNAERECDRGSILDPVRSKL